MADIRKLTFVGSGAPKLIKFATRKTATYAPPAAPVDEESRIILEAQQKRALDKAEAEAHVRALAEAQKPTEAESQKLPEPPPLSAEEIMHNWMTVISSEKAQKLDLEDRQKREELALQEEQLHWEKELRDADKKFIEEMHQRMGTRRPAPPVPQVPTVAEVAEVKPTRIRTFNRKCV